MIWKEWRKERGGLEIEQLDGAFWAEGWISFGGVLVDWTNMLDGTGIDCVYWIAC